MNINATSAATQVQGAQKLVAAKAAYGPSAAASAPKAAADKVEVSGTDGFQRLVAMAKDGGFRADKVADIKAQIASGTYDLDAKADAVADAILDDL